MTKTSTWPGMVRSGSTRTRPARSSGTPSVCARGTQPHRRPRAQFSIDPLRTDIDAVGVETRDLHAGPDGHAQFLELQSGRVREVVGVGRKETGACFDQDDARGGGVDMTEVARERLPRDLGQGAGQLDSGGSAADDHERQAGPPPIGSGSRSAISKAMSTRWRIVSASFKVFSPGAIESPVIMTEVSVRDARGENQAVVLKGAVGQRRRDFAAKSTAVTSASITLTFDWWRKILRMGAAMSAGLSAAVATW